MFGCDDPGRSQKPCQEPAQGRSRNCLPHTLDPVHPQKPSSPIPSCLQGRCPGRRKMADMRVGPWKPPSTHTTTPASQSAPLFL